LKTAVLYYLRNNPSYNKADVAREFENVVVDVLKDKTIKALDQYKAKTLIIAGGVIANKKLRETFKNLGNENLTVLIPTQLLSTDNALMIASATYINLCLYPELLKGQDNIVARGNLQLM
jgi:N6-L-threonylcarbamoyladenine synthase